MSKKEPKPLAIEDIAGDLGIAIEDVIAMLEIEGAVVMKDYRNRPAVLASSVAQLISRDDYFSAVTHAISHERQFRSKSESKNESLRAQRKILLLECEMYIKALEDMHLKYLNAVNQTGAESAGMAVYLLLSRAIANLKMTCFCLVGGYWYSGSMLRVIDECLDLANFFQITSATQEGKVARNKWFRANDAPSHSVCREAIAQRHAALLGEANPDYHLELMREIYRKKSKWIHPTFLAIREVAEYAENDSSKLISVDYGPCLYEYKLLELADFFQSSIWSTFQTMWITFDHLFTVAPEDIEIFQHYDLLFKSKADARS